MGSGAWVWWVGGGPYLGGADQLVFEEKKKIKSTKTGKSQRRKQGAHLSNVSLRRGKMA